MIQFKIDADKLPKADDLKPISLPALCPSPSQTRTSDLWRGAFPNLGSPVGLVSMAALMPALRAVAAGQGNRAPTKPAATQPPAAGAPGGSPGGQRQGRGGMIPPAQGADAVGD